MNVFVLHYLLAKVPCIVTLRVDGVHPTVMEAPSFGLPLGNYSILQAATI